jgi:hypothetical protein
MLPIGNPSALAKKAPRLLWAVAVVKGHPTTSTLTKPPHFLTLASQKFRATANQPLEISPFLPPATF